MPKISIILPVYNVEAYLPKAIDSVLAQTWQDFELLIVIDGSPDNSKQIAEDYAEKDNRIKIFEKENGGLSDARNYGMERASGEYIYFMDSDDWIEPNLLEECIREVNQKNLDFLIFGYQQDNENENGELLSSEKVIPNLGLYKKNEDQLLIDKNHLGLMGYAWNKVYKLSFLQHNNIIFEKGTSLVEDILFNAQVYTASNQIYFFDKYYYHYINRPVNTLIKQFHANSFELKKRKTNALNQVLTEWKVEANNKQKVLALSQIQGIRYCIHNLYAFQNNLSVSEKKKYISNMLYDELTQELINYYPTANKKDKVFKLLIKYKLTTFVHHLATYLK